MNTYQRILLLLAAAAAATAAGAALRARERDRAGQRARQLERQRQVAHDVDYVMEIKSWENAAGTAAVTHRERVTS